MFENTVYMQRRQALRQRLDKGIVLLIGHNDVPINFAQNTYPFRQDATFSYFFGINRPGFIGIIGGNAEHDTLFAEVADADDLIWQGEHASLTQMAEASGCCRFGKLSQIQVVINRAVRAGRRLHFLPPYRSETLMLLSRLTQLDPESLPRKASNALIHEIVALREIKSDAELVEIESALQVAGEMHRVAMQFTRPGVVEREVVAEMRKVLGRQGLQEAYAPIFSKRGEILHNLEHGNCLEQGDLVLNDAGASSAEGYASDITRTLPVGGRFLPHQRELYELLFEVQKHAIQMIRPGIPFLDIHHSAAMKLAEGMKELGFFSGDPADIVNSGAYALCMPHGLGHLLGLDVHDMESLGEDLVGYDARVSRSPQFGLCNLRLGKALKPRMVLTVEPGIYFIPALIKRWRAEKRHAGLIRYERFFDYEHFGGMRIEDVVLVGEFAGKVLGPAIPKRLEDIETAMS